MAGADAARREASGPLVEMAAITTAPASKMSKGAGKTVRTVILSVVCLFGATRPLLLDASEAESSASVDSVRGAYRPTRMSGSRGAEGGGDRPELSACQQESRSRIDGDAADNQEQELDTRGEAVCRHSDCKKADNERHRAHDWALDACDQARSGRSRSPED